MFPLVMGTSLRMAIPIVVLPLPLSPTKPTVLPEGTLNETFVTALISPIAPPRKEDRRGKQTVRLRTSRIFTRNA
jgi:hypothetical protein